MFWVRRLVVLGAPLALVAALVVWWTGRDDGATAQAVTPPIPEPTTTTQETSAGVRDCGAEQLALEIAPDAESFPPGVDPTFQVTITNSGPEPCLVDAGEAQRAVVVTSGDDRVWSSADCVDPDADARTLLLVGGQSDATQLAWPRQRSAPGCAGDLPAPGAGTYSVSVTLGGVTSDPSVFGLG